MPLGPTHHHHLPGPEVLLLLGIDADLGLEEPEAEVRLTRFGRNEAPAAKGPGLLRLWVSQFHHPLIYVDAPRPGLPDRPGPAGGDHRRTSPRPAEAADIGVAMGQGGSEVAKDFADMILTDDIFGLEVARTVAVNSFVVVEMAYLFNCRALTRPAWSVGWFSNRALLAGVGVMIALQMLFTYAPVMNAQFDTAALSVSERVPVLVLGLLTVVEVDKALRHRAGRATDRPGVDGRATG